jgi:hypothetical protein
MRPRSLYDQVIKPHEHELVWYSFRQKLPEVSPLKKPDDRPPGAELKSPQTIVSKQGDRGKQMIWRPLPQIKPQPEVAAPNILAFRMPLIQPPPPGPPRKPFAPPEAKPRKPTDPALLPEPPKVQAKSEVKQDPALTPNLVAALGEPPRRALSCHQWRRRSNEKLLVPAGRLPVWQLRCVPIGSHCWPSMARRWRTNRSRVRSFRRLHPGGSPRVRWRCRMRLRLLCNWLQPGRRMRPSTAPRLGHWLTSPPRTFDAASHSGWRQRIG